MKKTILLLGAVGVLMMTGCADEGITTDYGEWVATSEYSMDGTTENYRTIAADATAEKTEAASEKETEVAAGLAELKEHWNNLLCKNISI